MVQVRTWRKIPLIFFLYLTAVAGMSALAVSRMNFDFPSTTGQHQIHF
jgi:hypothetical protein